MNETEKIKSAIETVIENYNHKEHFEALRWLFEQYNTASYCEERKAAEAEEV